MILFYPLSKTGEMKNKDIEFELRKYYKLDEARFLASLYKGTEVILTKEPGNVSLIAQKEN
jgi:hypothetical protein